MEKGKRGDVEFRERERTAPKSRRERERVPYMKIIAELISV
jgi:hypothetical protein